MEDRANRKKKVWIDAQRNVKDKERRETRFNDYNSLTKAGRG